MEKNMLPGKTPNTDPEKEDYADLPKVKLPLRTKITLPYFGLALMLAIGAALITTKILFDTVEERFSNQLVEVGRLASENMVRQENKLLSTVRLLSFTDGVAQAIEEREPEKLRELTFGVVVNNREEAVEFLDRRGNIILSMRHHMGGNIEEYYFSTGGEFFRQFDLVTFISQGKSDDLGDKYSGWVNTDAGEVFYVSGPIYDSKNDLIGIVLVGKSLDSLTRDMREETLAQITLYSMEGQSLASTLSSDVSLDQTTIQEMLDRQDSESLKRRLGNRRDLTSSNVNYVEILGPWEGRGQTDLGILGVSLSEFVLVNASRTTRFQVLVLVATAFLLVILIGINLANVITRPVSKLVQASRAVARGEQGVSVDIKTRDEIGILAQSFNRMVFSLDLSRSELLQAYDTTLIGWSRTLELRDKEVLGHTARVADVSRDFAANLGVKGEALTDLWRGALLHDIGKMGIPDSILHKPEKLTEEEQIVMRQHPLLAYQFLRDIRFLERSMDIPLYHHERWDGSGYPNGLRGEVIPIFARIFAIVDVWDAMTNDRPYRRSISKKAVLKHIISQKGKLFDPSLIDAFINFIKPCLDEEN